MLVFHFRLIRKEDVKKSNVNKFIVDSLTYIFRAAKGGDTSLSLFFCTKMKQMRLLSALLTFYSIYAILYKKLTAELGLAFPGAFRLLLLGEHFF